MTLQLGADANCVDWYYTILRSARLRIEAVRVDANIALSGKDDARELALIGRNLNNEIATGWCAKANLQNSLFRRLDRRAATVGPAGGDEAACFTERGREVWGRLTLRFRL